MTNDKVITTQALIEKFKQALNDKWGYIWGTSGEQWTEAKQKALEKTTDPERESGRKYGSKWIGHKVTDCSGLFSWAFKQLGGYIFHGSDTMFRKYTTASGALFGGKRDDCKELIPGTAVFTYNKTKKKYGHVGLYIGNGLVIEAEGTIKGVVTSKVSGKWTYWGELTGVDYGTAAHTEPVASASDSSKPTLKYGSTGQYVTVLQTMLKTRGYDLGSYGIDGDFGRITENAVKKFQKDNGLYADGVVGPKTWEALENNAEKPKSYTVHIPNLTSTQANQLAGGYAGSWITED